MAKLQIVWKKSVTVKNAFTLHMLDLWSTYLGRWINLPHIMGKLSHFTNNFRRTFKIKLMRFRGWAMYGDKDKCSYFINHLGPEAQHRKLNSQSRKSEEEKMAQRTPVSPTGGVVPLFSRKGRENQQSNKTQHNKQPNQKRTFIRKPSFMLRGSQRPYKESARSTAFPLPWNHKPNSGMILVHPKDQRSIDENTGIVYRIPFGGCDKSYNGETARQVWTRKNGHQQDVEAVGSSYHWRSERIIHNEWGGAVNVWDNGCPPPPVHCV